VQKENGYVFGTAVPAHLQLTQECFTWGWHMEMPQLTWKLMFETMCWYRHHYQMERKL